MFRLKTKHSAMLRAFRLSSFEKTVLRRISIFNITGITLTEDVSSGYRLIQGHLIPHPSFSIFSSPGTKRFFSSKREKLLKWHEGDDVKDEDEVTVKGTIFDKNCDPYHEPLQYAEKTKIKNLLKVENVELFKDIAEGDSAVFKLLLELQVKLDITSCNYGVKLNLSKDEWLELLNISPSKRKSFIAFLILNTLRVVKKHYLNPPPVFDLPDDDEEDICEANFDDVMCYHLFHNSMFLKLRPGTMRKVYYSKGMNAILFSSGIVIDCSYGNYMAPFEIKDLARQINASASINFKSECPFHMVLCNFNYDDYLAKTLKRLNPVIYSNDYPLTITDKTYLDLFPKDQLVYLTPHCRTVLKNYDPDKTYIIGGFVDKTQKKPVSLAKAKEMKIPMAKFPLDEFLDWGLGDKCLSLPHVTKIMLDLRLNDGNWHKAFEVIPKRCLIKNKTKDVSKHTFGSEISDFYCSLDM